VNRRRTDPEVAVASLANAVSLAEGRLDPEVVAEAAAVAERCGARLGHGTDRTVVALLGATGSGKSSLFNAVVGHPVAATGVRRPTTSTTAAAVWGAEADALLDWLGVAARHRVDQPGGDLDGLVLLDVPDHDSVAVEHRLEMERIAAHTDVLVWVTDPEKYADAALHGYLRHLAGRDPLVLVVLNKADTLDPGALAACRSDLGRLLVADGLPGATVVPLSALTGAGVGELRAQLSRAAAARRAAVQRVLIEVAAAAEALARVVQDRQRPGGVGDRCRQALLDGLADAAGASAVEAVVAAGYRRDAAAHVGWPITRWVGRLRPHPLRRFHLGAGSGGRSSLPAPPAGQRARAEAAIRDAADEAAAGLDEPWPTVLRQAATPDPAVLHDRLDRAVAEAARHPERRPRWWLVLGLLQRVLVVAAIVGLVWLTALFALAWLQLPDPPLPRVGPVPVPTLGLVGGLLGGWLLALVGRWLARRGASRRAATARRRIQRELQAVAEDLVLRPVTVELRQREALVAALRGARP
jgi:GTP-binding protein EngB required for normal cell division